MGLYFSRNKETFIGTVLKFPLALPEGHGIDKGPSLLPTLTFAFGIREQSNIYNALFAVSAVCFAPEQK